MIHSLLNIVSPYLAYISILLSALAYLNYRRADAYFDRAKEAFTKAERYRELANNNCLETNRELKRIVDLSNALRNPSVN